MATESDFDPDRFSISRLPTMAQMDAERRGKPILKGESRLQKAAKAKPLTLVTEKDFKREVRTRDTWHCRKCQRTVQQTMSRVLDRAEVHHIHGRTGDLRFESRCAILLCLECHEQCTGRVNEKWIVVATKTFTIPSMPGRELTDARAKVTFERVA